MNAYDFGYEAFNKGVLDNPYLPCTEAHDDWESGYEQAEEDEQLELEDEA